MEIEKLKKWFNKNKRPFPWRMTKDPYSIWISEVMLQQTLASVVIPFYEKWMSLFPTIQDLAQAPIEEVIKAWEGLGYYSRARNLHAGAKFIIQNCGGKFPSKKEELLKVKGIGDYTAGAILSFAFKQKEPAVDGNVKRVTARLYAIEEAIDKPRTISNIKSHVEKILPNEKPWIVMEALIELGATVCKKKPDCEKCPMQNSCKAYELGMENRLPVKAAKIRYEKISRTVFILQHSECLLVKKVESGQVMQDLHEFPYIESRPNEKAAASFLKKWGLKARFKEKLPMVKHSFTRFRAELTPLHYETDRAQEFEEYAWVHKKDIAKLPFSSGHRRILKYLLARF